jgi:hypothetical protein
MIATHNSNLIDRAWRYIEKRPPSIQGSGGSTALFNVACDLIKGFLLKYEDAWSLLLRWNAIYSQPPWNESDLQHTLIGAAQSNRTDGYLLNGDGNQRTQTVPARPKPRTLDSATKRTFWPAYRPPKAREIEVIANLRRVPVTAVAAAARWGFLSHMNFRGHSCMVFHEGNFAQVRKLDGQKWKLADGSEHKVLSLPGSEGAFFGQKWLGGPSVRVLLVEGVIGILEAYAAHDFVNPKDGWTILAATSAGSRFYRDTRLLHSLAGRRVKLVPDSNSAGLDGAAHWLADLERVGCQVDSFRLPPGVDDLGSLVANADANMETLNRLFS